MLSQTPHAETLAWPLLDLAALRAGSLNLDPDAPGLRAHLQRLGRGDGAADLARFVWADSTTVPALLQSYGQQLLQRWGDQLRLRPDRERPGREILHWRAISLALPPVVLAATVTTIGRVTLLDPTLTPSGPVAQLHVHANAAYSFEVLWSHLAARAARGQLPWGELAKHPRPARRDDPDPPRDLTPIAWTQLLHLTFRLRRSLHDAVREARPDPRDPLDAIAAALDGRAAAEDLHVSIGSGRTGEPRSIAEVWERDPVSTGCPCPEVHLLHAAFARLPTADDRFKLRLTQYLRLLTLVWRWLVQDPAEAGLPSFARYFQRIKPLADGLKPLRPELLFDEAPLDLRAVEPRAGIPDDVARDARVLQDLDGSCEWGWVFHLQRRADLAPAGGARVGGPRWASSWREHHTELERLRLALQHQPSLLQHIRGVDLASVERDEPLWISAGLLADFRAAMRDLPGRPPGLTLHVGEDFRHLATGLRLVAEPFAWAMIERGDRLGHALALGLDVDRWVTEHPRVLLPRWDRLLDLFWMWDGAERRTCSLDTPSVSREILALQVAIWPDLVPLEPTQLVSLWRDLGDPRTLRVDLGYPGQIREPDDQRLLRLHRYLWDSDTRTRAGAIVDVPTTEADRTALESLRRALFTELARWQVAVEVNPSSNLLVADRRGILDQPMFRIRPIDPKEPRAIPIVLCSDDPLTFATRLADEYAYAWAAMVEECAPSYARAWLNEAADASFRHRFTLPRSQVLSVSLVNPSGC